MILGIGTDLIDARRIQNTFRFFGKRFLDRLFLPDEQTYVIKRLKGTLDDRVEKQQALHYAKLYAAKEAVLKALGTGLAQGLHWHHIEIKREASGKPIVQLQGRALEILAPTLHAIHLSLSDEWPYVSAFVIITGRDI